MGIWETVSDHYKQQDKPSRPEKKIAKILSSHPETAKDLSVSVKGLGMEHCEVTFTGAVNEKAARAAVFFVLPPHFKINVKFS